MLNVKSGPSVSMCSFVLASLGIRIGSFCDKVHFFYSWDMHVHTGMRFHVLPKQSPPCGPQGTLIKHKSTLDYVLGRTKVWGPSGSLGPEQVDLLYKDQRKRFVSQQMERSMFEVHGLRSRIDCNCCELRRY